MIWKFENLITSWRLLHSTNHEADQLPEVQAVEISSSLKRVFDLFR